MTITETATDLLYPLTLFRQMCGGPMPSYEVIDGAAMPEPYRRLLVHDGDMTSRLEAFHGGDLVLQILQREHTPTVYRREVILHLEEKRLPVEYGAIQIELDAFEPGLRQLILEEHLPLGGLLNSHGVRYHSEPRGFFKMGPDIEMNMLFSAAATGVFYGRSNELVTDDGRLLARIVELLRP